METNEPNVWFFFFKEREKRKCYTIILYPKTFESITYHLFFFLTESLSCDLVYVPNLKYVCYHKYLWSRHSSVNLRPLYPIPPIPCQEESGSVAKRTPVPDCEKVINYIKMVLYIRLTNRWKYTSPRCMALIDSGYAQTAIKFISCQCICLRVIKLGNSSKLWERKCCTRNCGIKIWESLRGTVYV